MADIANDKPVSKYQVELTNVDFSPEKGGWLRLNGKMRSGKPIHGTLFEGPALALHKKLGSIVAPGESVSSMNLVVDIVGRWIDRASTKGEDGNEKKGGRYFRIHEFDVLDGRALELARVSREAARALEVSQKVVDVEAAYYVLAEFAARIGRVTFDPSASAYLTKNVGANLSEDPTNEIPTSDPEEDAARRYEEQDRASGLTGAILDAPELNVEQDIDSAPEAPELAETAAEETATFDPGDEMTLEGSIDGTENAQEMEPFTLEDDSALSAEPVVTEESEPEFDTAPEEEPVREAEEIAGQTADTASLSEEEAAAEEPAAQVRSAPAIPARPLPPVRPSAPSRVPPRPSAPAPGPRR